MPALCPRGLQISGKLTNIALRFNNTPLHRGTDGKGPYGTRHNPTYDMPEGANRRIARNTIYLYLRTGITMAVALYTSRVVLNAMGIEDFGIWSVLGGVIAVFGFIHQSLSISIFRYMAHAIGSGDKNLVNKTYSSSIIIHAGLAVLIFILCETAGQWLLSSKLVIPEGKRAMAETAYHLATATSAAYLLTVPFSSVIIAYEKMQAFAFLSIAEALLRLAVAAAVYLAPTGKLVWYAAMILATTLLVLLLHYMYVRRSFTQLRFVKVREKGVFLSLLSFSGWSMFGNIAAAGYTQGLTILLNIFFGPVVNAARSISFQVEQAVRTFVSNFQSAINPQIIKNHAHGDIEKMQLLMLRSSRFSLFMLFLFALPIMLETEKLLYIWLGQVQPETVKFIRIMFCVIALETISNPIATGVMASGMIKRFQITVSTILIAIVPVSYLVLKAGAPAESVFIVYLAIEIIAVAARLHIASRLIKLNVRAFIKQAVGRPIPAITAGTLPPLLLHLAMPDGYMRFAAVIVCGGVTSLLSIYLLGLDREERRAVNRALKEKFAGKRQKQT